MGEGTKEGLSGHQQPGPTKEGPVWRQREALAAPRQAADSAGMGSNVYFTSCGVRGEVRLRAQLAARISCTQETSLVTRAYTPGLEVEQVSLPQDTMPTRVQAPFFWQTRGPPESPCRSGGRAEAVTLAAGSRGRGVVPRALHAGARRG